MITGPRCLKRANTPPHTAGRRRRAHRARSCHRGGHHAHGRGGLQHGVRRPEPDPRQTGDHRPDPRDKAYRYKAVPIALNDDVLVVAISDPLNFDTLDNLRFLLKREIETVCATPEQIKQALVKYYGSADEAGDVMMGGLGKDGSTAFDLAPPRNRTTARAIPPSSSSFRCCCWRRTRSGRATSTSNRWRNVSACASASTACSRRCRTRPKSCNRPSSAASRS